MVLSDNDMVPYKDNIAILKHLILKDIEGNDSYLETDKKRASEDDMGICRLLMSKKNDVKAAMEFFKKVFRMRKKENVVAILQSEFTPQILNYPAFHMYMGDKEGNVLLTFNLKDHQRNYIPKEIFKRYIFYWAEKLYNLDPYVQVTIVMNLVGAGLRNVDIGIVMNFLDSFQYFPQAIAHIFVVGMHWVFEAGYKLVKPFIPEEYSDRLQFINKTNELEQYLNMDEVASELNGTRKFDPAPIFSNYQTYVEEPILKLKKKKDDDLQKTQQQGQMQPSSSKVEPTKASILQEQLQALTLEEKPTQAVSSQEKQALTSEEETFEAINLQDKQVKIQDS